MSLLNSASPFTSSTSGKKEKMVPRMMKTFETITKASDNPSSIDEKPFPSDSSIYDKNNSQNERDQRVLHAMNKMTSSQIDGFQDAPEPTLGSYYTQPNSNAQQNKTHAVSYSNNIKPPMNTSKMEISSVQDKVRENFMSPASFSHNSSGSSYSESYRNQPYYTQLASKKVPTDPSSYEHQLMEKLNYMIHLLEEQQKEPTEHILEEFILYALLGIFMIYLVDSFTRVGKYTR